MISSSRSRLGAPRLPCMGAQWTIVEQHALSHTLKDLLELHSPLLHKANTISDIIIGMLLTSSYEKELH